MRAPLALACLCLATACRGAPPLGPPPAFLPKVPEGYGKPFAARVVLGVKDRKLRLPSGQLCVADDAACAAKLKDLRGTAIALELDAALNMADLSGALAALTLALDDGDLACLEAVDSTGRRCVPFRPFSGDDFGAWLDAGRPLGKLRIVMRTDGLEIVTDRGKVPGADRYGPSLPTVSGVPDLAGLESAVLKIRVRFPDETEFGLAPSPSITVAQVAQVLALFSGPGARRFAETFVVYP